MRTSWHQYFSNLARLVAARATCPRKAVGCVIVDQENRILVTGYNGSIKGQPHCDEAGCIIQNRHCVRTVHAEANAVTQAALRGVRLHGARVYVTVEPCDTCLKLLLSAGVYWVYYLESYTSSTAFAEIWKERTIKLEF